MMTLDLHGVRHYQVEREVENFVYLNQSSTPLEIVCGNSQRMINLVEQSLKRIGPASWEQTRWGVFVVRKL